MVKTKKKKVVKTNESDGAYFLKLVLYVVLGTLWIKFADPIMLGTLPINGLPVGLVLGLLFASHDHFQIDRKIEYAVLIIMIIISYFLPAGIML